jgi:signal transduction histidine kinase
LFYGALLLALGYHLFLFFSIKEASYLYFVLVIISSILFFATYEGIADQFLWPDLSEEKLPFLVITMALFFMAALKFSDVFLEQSIRAPRFHRLYYIAIGVWVMMIAITPFFSFGLMAKLASVLFLLTPLLAAVSGIYSWRKGYQPARFYLVSWIGFLFGVISLDLVRADILPSTPITEKAYHAGMIWLVLVWSLALADRINLLKAQTEDANRLLRNSQSRLSQILEGMPLGVVVYGKDAKPNYVNQRAVEILSNPARGIWAGIAGGRTVAQAIDYFSFRVAGSDQVYPLENMPVSRALQGEPASADDVEADLVDRRVPLEIWASPINDDRGNVETAVVAFQDITPRKLAEAELNEYREHLEKLVEQRTAELTAINDQLNREAIERKFLAEMLNKRITWLSAVNQVHQSINSTADLPQAYQQLTAIIIQLLDAQSAMIGVFDGQREQIDVLCYTQPDDQPPLEKRFPILLPKDAALRLDMEGGRLLILTPEQAETLPAPLRACFHTQTLHSVILAPMMTHEALFGLLGLGIHKPAQAFTQAERDLIERIAFDLADLAEDARLFEQARALVTSEERNRLARDLHDSVTQVLFSASLVAEVLPQIWQRDPAMAQHSLAELRHLTRGALAEMRTMLLELRPAAVIKTPLGELLTQLTEAVTSRSGLPFQLYIEKIPHLPEVVHTSFYRIAQEGLNNVIKHAQASLVTVSLNGFPTVSEANEPWQGEINLVIKDDGRGFSLQESNPGMGLSIIRERAASINATVDIISHPGGGTELTLVWHN